MASDKNFVQYNHHGIDVVVREDLKGTHREHCLCHAPCGKFEPSAGNEDVLDVVQGSLRDIFDYIEGKVEHGCARATLLYAFCREFGMTTPVFECPEMGPPKEE